MKKMIWIPVLILLLAGLTLGSTALLAEDEKKIERNVFVLRGAGDGVYLGIMMGRDDDTEGVKVLSVMDGSPAEDAGLEDGDLIVTIGGNDVSDTGDVADAVGEAEAGDKLKITVLRDGDRLNLTATLTERPESGLLFEGGLPGTFEFEFDEDHFAPMVEHFGEGHAEILLERLEDMDWHGVMEERLVLPFGRPKLGVELVRVTGELREHLGGDSKTGILVGKVMEESPAQAAGIEVGDLIISAGGEAITDTGDLLKAIHEAAGNSLDLEVIRDGRTLSLSADIPEESDEDVFIMKGHHRSALPVPPAPPVKSIDVRVAPRAVPAPPVLVEELKRATMI